MIRQFNRLVRATNKYGICFQRFNCKNRINRYQLFSTFSYRFSQADGMKNFDTMWQSAFNKIKEVKTDDIFDQFKLEIQQLSNYEMVLNYCLFILDVMKQRNEVEKANQVCNIAIEFCEKNEKNLNEPLLVMFKGQKALFDFKLGNKLDAEESSKKSKEQFNLVIDKLSAEDMIGAIKLLQEVFQTIENFTEAEVYAKMYQNLIINDLIRQNDPYSLFQSYSALFDCYYGQGKIQDALKYGISASEQIKKIQFKNLTMHYLLVGVSYSYYSLGQQQESDFYLKEAMDVFMLLPSSKENFDFEKKKSEYECIRAQLQLQSQQQQQQSQIKQTKEKYNSDNIWNETNDHGLELRGMKDFNEAIEFYEDVLKQLNKELDCEKIISIFDRIALVHYEMGDYQKAVNMSILAHEMLLKLRNQKLIGDKLSFQNLSNLKIFYYQMKDWEKAIEWGMKWHDVCEQVNAFSSYNMVLEEYMIQNVLAMKELSRYKEALAYSRHLQEYVFKFNSQDPTYAFSIYKLQYELNYFDANYTASLQCAIAAYENIQQVKEKTDQIQEESYHLLKNITALALTVRDEDKIMKYGVEYLEKQPIFESQNQFSRERQIIEQNIGRISSINGDLSIAETYLKKSLLSSQNLKMNKLELSSLISLATILVRQCKVEEAFKFINQAQQLSNQIFQGQFQENEINLSIARIYCFLYNMQKDYKQCLIWIDRCLQIQKNIPNLSNEQLQPTIELLKQLKQEIDDKDSVLIVANKHNISNLS